MERGPAREAAAAGQQVTQSGALDPATRAQEGRVEGTARAWSGVPALLHPARRRSRSTKSNGRSARGNRQRKGQGRLRAARRRDSQGLVPAGDQHRRLEVLPRQIGTPERERSVKQLIGRVVDTITGVGAGAEVLRERGRADLVQPRAEASARLSEGGIQQPGLVQLRLRESAAVLGLLHQLRAGHDGLDPDAGQDRGHALQVRLRHGQQPVARSVRRRSISPVAAPRRARCRS